MKIKVILQIFSGGFLCKPVSYEAVEVKLNDFLSRIHVDMLIMGWSPDKTLYEKTATFLKKKGIDFFLWFPVFSETGMLRSLSSLESYRGNLIRKGTERGEEEFSFCCPNNPQNIEMILDIFKKEFSSVHFDGIFLDRIRYPSFANCLPGQGIDSIFSCFCNFCMTKYKDADFNTEELKKALCHPVSVPLGISGFHGCGDYTFDDPIISRFFSLKGDFIYKSLNLLSSYFKEKNYSIGYDVFAPFLSPFVGQNLQALSGLCDFIKPMMYRATHAPAGMPFETEALLSETAGNDQEKRKRFYDLLGITSPVNSPLFDLDFSAGDLKNLVSISKCPVYVGVEINRIEKIADVYPDYIEETMEAYIQTGCQGFVLSWDMMDAPEDNFAKAAEVLNRKL